MGFRKYSLSEFSALRKQHNIMAFVGNGFDIQTMLDHPDKLDSQYKSTKFSTFFDYLYINRFDKENPVFKKLADLKNDGMENWSDIEDAIESIAKEKNYQLKELLDAITSLQQEFANFLQQVVSSRLQGAVGVNSKSRSKAIESLSKFCGDVLATARANEFEFFLKTEHYHLFNFLFINLNYTSLLDNFIHLDQGQFAPLPHWTVDRNFRFVPNPDGRELTTPGPNESTSYSSYVVTEVLHPHGRQEIPKSLLLGIDSDPETDGILGPKETIIPKELSKPYWGQHQIKYGDYFKDCELFIIFGCSLGRSDGWWWRRIVEQLSISDKAELVIYWWQSSTSAPANDGTVIDRFLDAAAVTNKAERETLRNKIFVVFHHTGSQRYWLNTTTI